MHSNIQNNKSSVNYEEATMGGFALHYGIIQLPVSAQQQEQVEACIQQLNEKIESYNTRAVKPYQIKFSYDLTGYKVEKD